ncbi:hypothetical protein TNCV_225751 [Trichonephila clavipes]|nr:hypothetical protein TNCV_225751 [Trichonephila clavipes]
MTLLSKRLATPGLDGRLSLEVFLSATKAIALFGLVPWRAFHHSSPFTNLMRGLVARRLFGVPPCRKGTIHLQTSMPSPGFEPTPYGTVQYAPLTTLPDGRQVMFP